MRNLLKCFLIIPLILVFQVIQAPAVTEDELKARQLELWNEQDSLNGEIRDLNKEVDTLGRANIHLKELLQEDGLVVFLRSKGRGGLLPDSETQGREVREPDGRPCYGY